MPDDLENEVQKLLTICLARVDAGVSESSNNEPIGPLADAEKVYIRGRYEPHFRAALEKKPDRWANESSFVLRHSKALGRIAGDQAVLRNGSVPSRAEVVFAADSVDETACKFVRSAGGDPPHPAGVWCGS